MDENQNIPLTAKQERFCQEYLVDLNGTQAAIRSGYSKSSAGQIAEQNLKKLEIQNRISQLQELISLRTEVSQDWVLNRFKEISDRCMSAVPVMVKSGGALIQKTDPDTGEGVWEFDSAGANKATEMIGKHLGFFKEDNKQTVIQYNTELTKEEIKEFSKYLNDKY